MKTVTNGSLHTIRFTFDLVSYCHDIIVTAKFKAKSSKSMTRFAIIKAQLVKSLEYQSPAEMQKIVADGLRDKVEAKGEKFICQEVSTVRAFDEWLGAAPVAPEQTIIRLTLTRFALGSNLLSILSGSSQDLRFQASGPKMDIQVSISFPLH